MPRQSTCRAEHALAPQMAVARLTADGRVVSILEGGYGAPRKGSGGADAFDRGPLAESAAAHVAGLCGLSASVLGDI